MNYFYEKACELYDKEKYDFELSDRAISGFIRLIHVKEKDTDSLYAVCVISITYDQLPRVGLNLDQRFLYAIQKDNQEGVTKTEMAVFQISEGTIIIQDKRLYTISNPVDSNENWTIEE